MRPCVLCRSKRISLASNFWRRAYRLKRWLLVGDRCCRGMAIACGWVRARRALGLDPPVIERVGRSPLPMPTWCWGGCSFIVSPACLVPRAINHQILRWCNNSLRRWPPTFANAQSSWRRVLYNWRSSECPPRFVVCPCIVGKTSAVACWWPTAAPAGSMLAGLPKSSAWLRCCCIPWPASCLPMGWGRPANVDGYRFILERSFPISCLRRCSSKFKS